MKNLILYMAFVLACFSGFDFANASISQTEILSVRQGKLLVQKCLQKLQSNVSQNQFSEESIKEVVDQVLQQEANEGIPELEDNRMKKMIIVLVGAALACGFGYLVYRCIDTKNHGDAMLNAATAEYENCLRDNISSQQAAQRVFNAGVGAVGGRYQNEIRRAFPVQPTDSTVVVLQFGNLARDWPRGSFNFNPFESAHQAQDYYQAMFS